MQPTMQRLADAATRNELVFFFVGAELILLEKATRASGIHA